jgi:putative flippase GtrA
MSHTLAWTNALLCAFVALRLLLFRRGDASHRPAANLLAYLLIVAAGAVPLLTLFDRAPATGWPQLILNAVLTAAVFAVRGNVVELFRPVSQPESWLTRFLRKTTWI